MVRDMKSVHGGYHGMMSITKIDGERISVELKQDIYKAVFQKGKKVTKKQLCKYLHTRGIIETEEQVTGVDVSINNVKLLHDLSGRCRSLRALLIQKDVKLFH